MSHLISDMGGEFEGELGEFVEAHGIPPIFHGICSSVAERI